MCYLQGETDPTSYSGVTYHLYNSESSVNLYVHRCVTAEYFCYIEYLL